MSYLYGQQPSLFTIHIKSLAPVRLIEAGTLQIISINLNKGEPIWKRLFLHMDW